MHYLDMCIINLSKKETIIKLKEIIVKGINIVFILINKDVFYIVFVY